MNSDVHIWLFLFFVYLFQSKNLIGSRHQMINLIGRLKRITATKRGHRCSRSAFGKVRFLGHIYSETYQARDDHLIDRPGS